MVTHHPVCLVREVALDVEDITCGTFSSPSEGVGATTFVFIGCVVHVSCDALINSQCLFEVSCGGIVTFVHSFVLLRSHQGAFHLVQSLSKDQRCGRAPFGAQERDVIDRLFGGRVPVGTGAPTQKPSEGAPSKEPALTKAKCASALVSGFLSVLVGPAGFSFPGSGLWFFFVSVCFFFLLLFLSIGRGRHVPAPGWEGRRVKRTGTDPRTGGGADPRTFFQVSLYTRLSCVPRRACPVLCLPVCYSFSAYHDWSHDREAFRLLMTGYSSCLRCPRVLFVLKLCKTAKCPSFVCYRFECTFQVMVFQFKREHAVGRRSRISQEMTSGAVSAFLVRQRIHEPIRQSTDFGKFRFST